MDLQAIEARLEAAPEPEKWQVEEGWEGYRVFYKDDGPGDLPIAEEICQGTDSGEALAEFIAHAPEDIRALIEEVGRLTVEHLEMRIESDNLRERRDYYRKALMKADGEIEAAKALHRKMPLYDMPSDECAEHDQDVYSIELDSGEWYCSEHIAEWVCSECFNDGGEYVEYPCSTARALGVTE